MRQTAHAAETRQRPEEEAAAGRGVTTATAARDRLLLVIDPAPVSAALIRRGRRVADYLGADCLAVYVSREPGLQHLTEQERDNVQRHLNFARGLQIETQILEGQDLAETVVSFARELKVTQIFVTRQPETTFQSLFSEGLVSSR
jgi:two-component system sensor histidine kinase KdpD